MLFWSKLLIGFFRTSAFNAAPVDLLSHNFHRGVESVTKFGQRASKLALNDSQSEFQRILLLGLTDTKIGIYSNYHDNSGESLVLLSSVSSASSNNNNLIEIYLTDSLRAWIRASINDTSGIHVSISPHHFITLSAHEFRFTTCLDSAKSGLRLSREAFKEDQKQYGRPRASCMVALDKSRIDREYQTYGPPKRKQSLGTFILDNLVATGNELRDIHLRAYGGLKKNADWKPDRDLTKPFKEAEKRAKEIQRQGFSGFVDELEIIKAHVVKVREAYRTFWASPSKRGEKKKKSPDFACQFVEGPPEDSILLTADVAAIKASYAYYLSANFALTVAFRELCTIKAIASQHLPVTRSFAEAMSIGASFVRVLAERGDE
jgi:RNA-dependent RNA polymerase